MDQSHLLPLPEDCASQSFSRSGFPRSISAESHGFPRVWAFTHGELELRYTERTFSPRTGEKSSTLVSSETINSEFITFLCNWDENACRSLEHFKIQKIHIFLLLDPADHLTHLGLVGLSVLGQLDELFGEHAAAVTQDVSLQLHVWTRTHKLHHDRVAGGVNANLHVLTPHCRNTTEEGGENMSDC